MNTKMGILTIVDARIVSVEKGNCENIDAERFVCAFSVEAPGSALPIKVLLKSGYADLFYNNELKDGSTKSGELVLDTNSGPFLICHDVSCSFTGYIREVRSKEIVVENPFELVFNRITSYESIDDECSEDSDDQA